MTRKKNAHGYRRQTLDEIARSDSNPPKILKTSVPFFIAALQALAEHDDWVRCSRGLGWDKSYYVGHIGEPSQADTKGGAHCINPETGKALERQGFMEAEWNPDDPIDTSMGAMLRITDKGWRYMVDHQVPLMKSHERLCDTCKLPRDTTKDPMLHGVCDACHYETEKYNARGE